MDRAAEIANVGASVQAVLDEKHQAREVTLRASRSTIQCSAASIRATQRGEFDRAAEMVARERQLKGWTRSRKLELIHNQNPEMVDYARRTTRDPSLRQPPLRMTKGPKNDDRQGI